MCEEGLNARCDVEKFQTRLIQRRQLWDADAKDGKKILSFLFPVNSTSWLCIHLALPQYTQFSLSSMQETKH